MACWHSIRYLYPSRADELFLTRRVENLVFSTHEVRQVLLVQFILKRRIGHHTLHGLDGLVLHLSSPAFGLISSKVVEHLWDGIRDGQEAGRFLEACLSTQVRRKVVGEGGRV